MDAGVSRGEGAGGGPVSRWPSWLSRGSRRSPRDLAIDLAVLSGLAGVAVTQPLLDLLGPNPTFFVAGNYSSGQIIMLALVIAVVPALIVFAITAPPSVVGDRWGTIFHGVGVAFLAGVLGLVVARTLGIESPVPAFIVASGFGIGVAILEWRAVMARRFLSYLTLGNVAFVVLFLVASPSAELLGGASFTNAGGVKVPPLDGPVIVMVLDEFPLTSLIDGEGNIIEERYPNLAALAEETTWFRNAATESRTTFISVPTLLSSVRGDENDLPSYRDYPRNYFTLFESRYPTSRYEAVTDLCPPDTCTPLPRQSLRQALEDASVVYGHRMLPDALRDELPAIDRSWGNFGDDVADESLSAAATVPPSSDSFEGDPMARLADLPEGDGGRVGQAGALRRQIERIGDDPSVHFVHVLLPHHPYVLTPWGSVNAERWIPASMPQNPGDPGYDWAFRELYTLQAWQLGATDQMVGELVDRLKEIGAWDDSLLVMTSDHGIDITPPGVGRTPNDDNIDELFRVPLFIKAPGQTTGEVRDDPASTVDVLPSIIDLLDIDTDWTFEGHSLFDGSEPTMDRVVTSDVEAAFEVAERHIGQFPRGQRWDDLTAVGEGADLVGRPVAEFTTGTPSELTVSFDHRDLLADLSTTSGPVPYWLGGTVTGTAPPELAVAINGTFAGTIGGYRPDGDAWRFTGVMANEFVDGANEVVAYEIERVGDGVILHEVGSR